VDCGNSDAYTTLTIRITDAGGHPARDTAIQGTTDQGGHVVPFPPVTSNGAVTARFYPYLSYSVVTLTAYPDGQPTLIARVRITCTNPTPAPILR
jgi:hypothetical protein